MRYRPEEEAAYPLSSVVNFEPLAGADLVFWYSPTGKRAFDAFFIHGGFFSPNNAPAGQSVAVDLGDIDVTFTQLDEAGIVTAEQIDPPEEAGALPPGAVVFENNAFDIDATAPFSGPVLVAFTAADVNDPDVFARLRIFHNENGILVDRTLLPSDFASRTVRAQVGSLSPFVLMARSIRREARSAQRSTRGCSPALGPTA